MVAKSLATLENLLKKSKKLIKFGLMEYNWLFKIFKYAFFYLFEMIKSFTWLIIYNY